VARGQQPLAHQDPFARATHPAAKLKWQFLANSVFALEDRDALSLVDRLTSSSSSSTQRRPLAGVALRPSLVIDSATILPARH